MDRAGDRSVDSATSGAAAPAVTSWWAGAQTTKEEKREGGNGSLKRTRESCSRCTTSRVGAGTGGHLGHDPGLIAGRKGEGRGRSTELPSPTTDHRQRHQPTKLFGCCKRLFAPSSSGRKPRRGNCKQCDQTLEIVTWMQLLEVSFEDR